jgi:hypothetical protein
MAKDKLVLIYVRGGVVQDVVGNDNHYVVDWDNNQCPICNGALDDAHCPVCLIDWDDPYEKIIEKLKAIPEE